MKKKEKLRFSKMMKKEKVPKKKMQREENTPEKNVQKKEIIPEKPAKKVTPTTLPSPEIRKIERPITEEKKQENFEYMVFKVDSEMYGVKIDYVKEIVNKTELLTVPNLPHFVIGLLEMRKGMIPVINIRERFKIGKGNEGNSIIITHIKGELVGFLVDKVMEIIKVEKEEIMAVPFIFDEKERSYITGIIEFNDDLISILQVENILEEEELTKIENLSKE